MPQLMTNRDFYLAVAELCDGHKETARPLQEYLRALLSLGRQLYNVDSLSVDEFYGLLRDAFEAETGVAEEIHISGKRSKASSNSGYDRWEETIVQQIVDLQEMARAGMLD